MAHNVVWFETILGGMAATPGPGSQQSGQAAGVGFTAAVSLGYRVPGDGGGGLFYWDASSSAPPDNGLVFAVSHPLHQSPGRWIRLDSLPSATVGNARVSNGPLNVRWFGARGDMTGDDTAAVQSAIDAANGGSVFFPVGAYTISRELTVPANTNLIGVGYKGGGSTLAASADITVMSLTNPRVGIEHLDFDGRNIVTSAALSIATSEVLVRDSRFLDCGRHGIYCSGAESDISIERCRLTGRSLTSSCGVFFDMTSSGNIRTLGNYVTNFDTGIKVSGIVGSIHIGNYFEVGTTGAWLQDSHSCWLTNTFENFKSSDFLVDGAETMPTIIGGRGSGSAPGGPVISYANGADEHRATIVRNEGDPSQFPILAFIDRGSDPVTVPGNAVFLFATDDGGRNRQLVARFGSGTTRIIAAET